MSSLKMSFAAIKPWGVIHKNGSLEFYDTFIIAYNAHERSIHAMYLPHLHALLGHNACYGDFQCKQPKPRSVKGEVLIHSMAYPTPVSTTAFLHTQHITSNPLEIAGLCCKHLSVFTCVITFCNVEGRIKINPESSQLRCCHHLPATLYHAEPFIHRLCTLHGFSQLRFIAYSPNPVNPVSLRPRHVVCHTDTDSLPAAALLLLVLPLTARSSPSPSPPHTQASRQMQITCFTNIYFFIHIFCFTFKVLECS